MESRDDPKVEEMLQGQFLPMYKSQLNKVWHELIYIRESMYIVSGIQKYPLNLFVTPRDIGFFWNILQKNCGDAVLLGFNRLVNDDDRGNLSLHRLKNSVMKWLRAEHTDWFKERLRESRFSTELKSIAQRVKDIRNGHIAHLDWPADASEPEKSRPAISETEAEELYLGIVRLFDAICLTSTYVVDMRRLQVGVIEPHAVERFLDSVAKDSNFINRPERPPPWDAAKKHMDPDKLAVLNKWRIKFKMPPA